VTRFLLVAAALAAAVGCAPLADTRDPFESAADRDPGKGALSPLWSHVVEDRSKENKPQEFAVPIGATIGRSPDRRAVFVGSSAGDLVALRARDGKRLWVSPVGPISSSPLVSGNTLYVGTDDGRLVAVDLATGKERWHYDSRGSVLGAPVIAGDSIFFANERDKVFALDRDTGKWRWEYERESPDEFSLRGHAGVTVAGDLLLCGFADGNVVALAASGGETRWIKSLAAGKTQFIDVDTTPVVVGDTVYAASSSGGLYGLDLANGDERWRLPLEGVAHITTDGSRLYVSAAVQGLAAIDFAGRLLWRQGFARAGDPSRPVLEGNLLLVSIADRGLYVVDKRSGRLLQYFDPGNGVSAAPAVDDGRVFIMSNGAVLYAMNLSE
jgi:outer membrane protein assembly factor BamB